MSINLEKSGNAEPIKTDAKMNKAQIRKTRHAIRIGDLRKKHRFVRPGMP